MRLSVELHVVDYLPIVMRLFVSIFHSINSLPSEVSFAVWKPCGFI